MGAIAMSFDWASTRGRNWGAALSSELTGPLTGQRAGELELTQEHF